MNKIWKFTRKQFSDIQKAYLAFIFILTFSWTIPPFLITLAGGVLLHMQFINALSCSLSVCGLTGIFIGFFGSLLFLLRKS